MEGNIDLQEILNKPVKTQAESILIQAIATLSTQPQFALMTPWEVFNHIKKIAQEVDKTK
jgi:hypothetical protein